MEENTENYTLLVNDNGIGIAEDQKLEVFNMFNRLNDDQQYEGTGMGLAMVKKSIERLGGEIWLESKLDEGTTETFQNFVFELKFTHLFCRFNSILKVNKKLVVNLSPTTAGFFPFLFYLLKS